MLNEGVVDGKQSAARSQRKRLPQAGVGKRSQTLIELRKSCPRCGDIRTREIRKRRTKLRVQAKSRQDPAQVDDLGPDRQRRYEMHAVQRSAWPQHREPLYMRPPTSGPAGTDRRRRRSRKVKATAGLSEMMATAAAAADTTAPQPRH
jgi:hypothetical protein